MTWKGESKRHSLASKGIKTATKQARIDRLINNKIRMIGDTDPLPFDKSKLDSFHLPIETALYVPSTTAGQKKISDADFQSRIIGAQAKLSKLFGGYSRVELKGGFRDKHGKIIKERVAKITVFTTKKDLMKNRKKFSNYIVNKQKSWNQESVGFEVEGDLYYLNKKTR